MDRLTQNIENHFNLFASNKPWIDIKYNKRIIRRNQFRNNESLSQGLLANRRCDVYVPGGVLRAAGFTVADQTCKGDETIELINMMSSMQEESKNWILPLDSCCLSPSGSLNISISRRQTFEKVLKMVQDEGDRYGYKTLSMNQDVLLHCAVGPTNQESDMTLTQLRALLLRDHMEIMLKSVKLPVHNAGQPNIPIWISEVFLISRHEKLPTVEHCTKKLQTSLEESEFRVPTESMTEENRLQASNACNVLLNVSGYVEEQRTIGKNYSKNIKTISVNETGTESVNLLEELSMIEFVLDSLKKTVDIFVLHITSHDREYKQQCLDILQRICSQHKCQHVHLVHGHVQVESSMPPGHMQISAHEFFKVRSKQMRKASEMKHGETIQGEMWDARIARLTSAALKFELLGTSPHNNIKLNLGEEAESRDGVFVMYNYARLSTLFNKLEQRVHAQYYPPLPDIKDIDFSFLKEEAEWYILFQYILPFPDIVAELLQPIFNSIGPRIQLQTHKICAFLMNLSKDLSTYYSRTHVLGEPRQHLLPVMFARLHLLKAVQRVMLNSLSLLNIQPLQQM
ncbi:DALR anticodon-binding domain-containing protein 3-like [Antedon mediterranea]|uniref:DALR anticodon-binding domain-containing protein 3-like n=1 Tax=Antedon mediterranea TaxID=105859 RepID=UPI003AF93A1C